MSSLNKVSLGIASKKIWSLYSLVWFSAFSYEILDKSMNTTYGFNLYISFR